MTREQAKREIDFLDFYLQNHTNDYGEESHTAMRMAYQALEQQSTLDKIIAEINGMYRVILKGTPKDDWAVRWNDCLDEVLHIIDKYRK